MGGKRRGRHEGTVRQRTDGRWEVRREIGISQDGKRRQIVKYGKTKSEALAKMAAAGLSAPAHISTNATVAEYFAMWLQGVRLSNRAATYRLREGTIRKHINPYVGGIRLRDLTQAIIIRLFQNLERSGIGRSTQVTVFGVMSAALNAACAEGCLTTNPLSTCPKPKVERREMYIWTGEQARRFLSVARASPYEALFVLALTTAMREGELFALKWDDIDFQRRTIFVQHTLTESLDGRLTLTPPKTAAGRRRIMIPAMAVEALRRHLDAVVSDGTYSEIVFTTSSRSGQRAFLRKSNFIRREYAPLVKMSGLPELTFHGLRHVANSLLLESGISANVMADRMGHSSTRMTLDTYAHVSLSGQAEAAAKAQSIFQERPGGTAVVKPPYLPPSVQMKKTRKPFRDAGPGVVEVRRLELLTPYMRSKCSTS